MGGDDENDIPLCMLLSDEEYAAEWETIFQTHLQELDRGIELEQIKLESETPGSGEPGQPVPASRSRSPKPSSTQPVRPNPARTSRPVWSPGAPVPDRTPRSDTPCPQRRRERQVAKTATLPNGRV